MSSITRGLRRWALVLALAPIAVAAVSAPALAYDRYHDHHRDRHWHARGGGYYAPPPPVYYPQQPASPGISLFFPIR
jgi:hypothetical protein